MGKIYEILEREDGCLSLPRFCSFIGFIIGCSLIIMELYGHEAKHLPEFLLFDAGLFGYCVGSKYLDIKKEVKR